MTLEEFTAKLNTNIFLKEFSFSQNTFTPKPAQTLELADQIVWIDDLLIVCQLKERTTETTTPEEERKWFENKVLKKAKLQIGDTLKYIKIYEKIKIQNQRGHDFEVDSNSALTIDKLIIYAPGKNLPEDCLKTKSYPSKTAGFIHVFPINSYLGICQTLITPAEIHEYLVFREKAIQKWEKEAFNVSEQALVGQFLSGIDNDHECPNEDFQKYLHSLKTDLSDFDLRPLLSVFKERIEHSTQENDYYKILTEFARLNRVELEAVKTRLDRCSKDCSEKDPPDYYRVYFPRTKCGFIFVPIPTSDISKRRVLLEAFTTAAKYDHKSERQVGVLMARDGAQTIVDWCFLGPDFPYIEEAAKKLRQSGLLRKPKELRPKRYDFDL
ncbi:hypothetical protein HI113_03780 [Corallococcus exiguus]|uniref:hypothetical protein n=1 Tax=Corallococcus exiguus TaxID=83462 RepID=UPI001473E6E6|nr:hypothetical protein [Corallococcus exiguus]NNB93031.1 hypothetical protein [Corallococcus exiguus]